MNTTLTENRTVALTQLGESNYVLTESGTATPPAVHAAMSRSACSTIGSANLASTGLGSTGFGPNAVITDARVRDAKQAAPPRGELH